MIDDRVWKVIRLHWEQMINSTYFYHGMSFKNIHLELDIVLDPTQNPYENIIPVFIEYSHLLFKLIKAGLEFNVDDFYVEPLHKILTWTMRDIQNPGIDFTTNYADAAAYAFNYAGSQIKHNFNLIVKSIYKHKQHSCFAKIDQKHFWELTENIRQNLDIDSKTQYQPVVVKVKRSCAAFQNDTVQELNFGPYDFFKNRIKNEALANDLFAVDKMAFFLHRTSQANNFNIRLIKPLHKSDIEEVIML
jgi:hypothetical protein